MEETLAKTKRTIINEEKKREVESPSHKKRREEESRLRDIARHGPRLEDDDYDDIVTYERIKRHR